MKRVLTVGLNSSGAPIDGVEIEKLGLCQANVEPERAAFPLHEYDVIVINPQRFMHFCLERRVRTQIRAMNSGCLSARTNASTRRSDGEDRRKELTAAIAAGAIIVWCLAEPKRMNFFGYREAHLGYLAPKLTAALKRADLLVKKGRRFGSIDPDSPFVRYFESLAKSGWTLSLADAAEFGDTRRSRRRRKATA